MADPPAFICHLCGDRASGVDGIADHIRVLHPDAYGNGPQRWPDGEILIEDCTHECAECGQQIHHPFASEADARQAWEAHRCAIRTAQAGKDIGP